MTVVASTNEFSQDLLTRCAALQDSLAAIKWAVPRFWEPIGNRPFPGFYNRIANVTPDHTKGLPIRTRVYLVEMRLIVGALNAGYKGENEGTGYEVQDMILDLFDSRRRLELPPLGALRYVEKSLMQPVEGGVQPFDYTDVVTGTPPLFYLGIPYFLEVTANHNVGRTL